MPVLQFKGKTAIESYHHTVAHHILELDGKLSVLGKGGKPGLDGNLIIEGDNLIALKALLPTHAGRIKCIYIDPPYNTGNERWVYNDNLTQPQFKEWIGQTVGKEGEDATRHDKWCCMMYPRLQLLKELLSEKGAIFISIDDNELARLLLLMNEIFGEENRFGIIVIENNPRGRRLGTDLAVEHEYLVVWTRNISLFEVGRLTLSEEQLEEFSYEVNGKAARLLGLRKRGALSRRDDRPNLHFPIFVNPQDGRVDTERRKGWEKVVPRLSDGTDGVWRWEPAKVKRDLDQLIGRQVKRQSTGSIEWDIFQIDFAHEESGELKGRLFGSIWQGSEYNNETAGDQIKQIFGEAVFDFPKPVGLVKELLRVVNDGDCWVLDSFAGSGTTAHAALELNEEDGGKRKFILVQVPSETKEQEKDKYNICQKITAERVRRVIHGYTYTTPKGKKENVPGLGGSFTYARVGRLLFGEYRDWGKQLPAYEELAKYIFYTETSRDFDRKMMNEKIGKIGEHHGTSYYLLYTPEGQEDRRLDTEWLKALDKTEKNRNVVVYCEKKWVHPDDLRKYELETKRTVRPMIVPFNLK